MLSGGAAQAYCRLALVLAVDVSTSVNSAEYRLQRDGLAAALDAPEVRQAILAGLPDAGEVMLAVYEWSGRYQQQVVLDWTVLDSSTAIDAAVARLAGTQRSHNRFPTAMGYGLGYGAGLLRRAPACDRRVIDLSGDGINNDGFGPDRAYANFPFDGVVVNGLVILGQDSNVEAYYRREVLRGPGAFLEVAQGFADFREAMTRKLYREINLLQMGADHGDPPEAPG
ncbi:DUF1194 domain-containing protein [Maritimibacter alkaliphilus]|uniref:DUF1194 domain-containing protein n=1 Tax=Maritimibacter alkaliphilus TaxID=404236 RepID=UPI001C985B36|nr:DUF1194 domain-containing protein [Maritimibacter alkaliphilus]MBY6091369.1 DUF1194 domain-containing protein [Maritimibacter alkaliphilus]